MAGIGSCSTKDVVIPSTFKSKPVIGIGERAFAGCDLTSVTIPDSVTSIGIFVFAGCDNLKTICYTGDIAGWCGIDDLTGLRSMYAKYATLYIGDKKIEGDLIIPNGVTSIGWSAFNGCSGLTSVTIPDSVTSIGGFAFGGCGNLKTICYTGDIVGWCGIDGLTGLMSEDVTLYIGGNKIEGELIIPDGVTSIDDYAFRGCSGLTSVTIPDSVTSIGDNAFYNCSDMTSVTIPKSVTSIGINAFFGCTGLTSIKFEGTIGQWKAIERMGIGAPSTCQVVCTDGTIAISEA